jgi:hypothetical protein
MAINWNNDPPHEASNYGYRLIRTPPYKPIRGIVLSENLLGTRTHFTRSRTIPCQGEGCEHCAEGLPWRWHGYLAMILDPGKEKVIIELTAQAAEQLKPTISGFGSLRCVEILCERPSKRPNGRVRILARRNGIAPNSLPEAPEIQKIMLHIWGLDDQPLRDSGRAKGVPRLSPAPAESGELPISDSAKV